VNCLMASRTAFRDSLVYLFSGILILLHLPNGEEWGVCRCEWTSLTGMLALVAISMTVSLGLDCFKLRTRNESGERKEIFITIPPNKCSWRYYNKQVFYGTGLFILYVMLVLWITKYAIRVRY
jgi:hypothetical protein